nr:hypothetical protein [bacterium]
MKQNVLKIVSVFLILLMPLMIQAEGKDGARKSLQKPSGTPTRTVFNINNISTWIYNNGDSDYNPSGDSGFEYPKGSNLTAVFETGFVWGGKIDGVAHVGGSTYNHGVLGGKILPDGTPEDPNASHVRIYRVRTDWQTADLSDDVKKLGLSEDDVRDQYETDWNEWRAQDGAPFEDVNANGTYEPSVDIPGVPGADQTIWYVSNDFDSDVVAGLYGSDPMKVEVHTTVWGYKSTTALGYTMFRRYKIINKNDKDFEEMYVSLWSDVDLGDAGDDFAGCDVPLSLSFCYNGAAYDSFYGNTPPAIGFDFFQGPVVDGIAGSDVNNNGVDDAADYAIKYGKKIGPGKVNIPMSAHYFFINSDNVYSDPDLRDYNGTLQFFNLFEGKVTTTGLPFVDPTTGLETKFTLSGDPLTGTGWVDGILHSPGDRRQGMVAGPFTMAVGDTQEIVVAEIVAGAFGEVDRLGALGLLKFYDKEAQATYDNFFHVPRAPAAPTVNVDELPNEMVLSWYQDYNEIETIESHDDLGYQFQGYVIYQLPYEGAPMQNAKRVATFDIKDGKGKIIGDAFDPAGGVVNPQVLQFGSDSGIKRSVSITQDLFNGNQTVYNGTPYYYAISTYAVHEDQAQVPLVLESQAVRVTATPQALKPGNTVAYETNADLVATQTSGTANATVSVKVVNPTETTGHDYKVWFNQQHYYLDSDGIWKFTNFPDSVGKKLGKDVAGSSVSGVAKIASASEYDLQLTLDLVTSFYSYCDGVKLTFPPSVTIYSADDAGDNHHVSAVIDEDANTVTWGSPDTTQAGPFVGGDLMVVKISRTSLPLEIGFEIWDDGWGEFNAADYGATDVMGHATGTFLVTKEANYFETRNHWNVMDMTTGQNILEDQEVINPDGIAQASSKVFDGIQVYVDGGYAAPLDFSYYVVNREGYTLDGRQLAGSTTRNPFGLTSYGAHGWAATAMSADAFGNGTRVVDILQKDYELRFTGEYEDPDANGIVRIKEGTGSIATVYNARGMDGLEVHPMNPSPGSDASFTVRIPFEIWNVDDDQQVNVVMVDRVQAADANPFYAFNPAGRMYVDILNTPYSEEVQDVENDDALSANLTWNLVFWFADWQIDDVVELSYANPIQLGVDEFDFTVNAPAYSKELAKDDVKEINVFPNPYYGVNPNEINKYQRFVTFSHLP